MSDLADFPPIEAVPMPAHVTEVLDAAPAQPQPETAVALMRRTTLAELSAVERGIAKLKADHGATDYDITTPKGLQLAKDRRLAVREVRYQIPHTVKARKAELQDVAEALENEAERITAELLKIETPHDEKIKAREKQLADEKAERERIAAERAQKQAEGVAAIRAYLSRAQTMPDMTAERVATGIAMLQGMTFAGADWLDPVAAANAQCETLEGMRALHATLKAREEAAAAAEAQRLENERVAKELAEAQAKLAAEQQRVARITAMIQEIRDAATGHADQDAAALLEARTAVAALNVGAELYQEFAVVAQAEKAATLAVLDKLHAEAVDREAHHAAEVSKAIETLAALPTYTPPPAPELLSQDLCRDLSKALSADPAAPLHAREAVATIEAAAGDQSAITEAVAEPDPQAAFLALVMSAFDCKFPSHPKPSQEWWAKVRAAGQQLQGAPA